MRSSHPPQSAHPKMNSLNSPGEKFTRRSRISAMALELVWQAQGGRGRGSSGEVVSRFAFFYPGTRPRRTTRSHSAQVDTLGACGAREVKPRVLVHCKRLAGHTHHPRSAPPRRCRCRVLPHLLLHGAHAHLDGVIPPTRPQAPGPRLAALALRGHSLGGRHLRHAGDTERSALPAALGTLRQASAATASVSATRGTRYTPLN